MKRMAWYSIGAAALALFVGCGGKVVVDDTTTTTTAGTGGGGGAPAKICGGTEGLSCGPDEWCQWDVPGSCGGTGTCHAKPTGPCTDPCGFVPMCGCDGNLYCNPCEAHMAGVDVHDSIEACMVGPTAEYAAFALPTDAPRYVITKTDWAADRCVAVFMVGFQTGITNVDVTMGWGVERIFVTPSAQDCTLGPNLWPAPPGEEVKTDIAEGSIKQDSSDWPCWVEVDVAIAWPPGSPAWVPAEETMQAAQLVIQGGACGE